MAGSRPRACAAIAVMRPDGALLCVRRRHDPGAGRWTLPGGHLQEGESPRRAAIRELREETAIAIDDCVLLGVYHHEEPGHDLLISVFHAQASGDAHAGDDAVAAGWFQPSELREMHRTEGLFEFLSNALGS